jgi:hypothetical protein
MYRFFLCWYGVLLYIVTSSVFAIQDRLLPRNLYKIAVVKQVTYQDLYCAPSNASKKDIVFSTFKRTGPAGLFSYLNADFYIVDVEPESECNIWKEKVAGGPFGASFYEGLKHTIPYWGEVAGHTVPQGTFSVSYKTIAWEQYAIVICLDIPIPGAVIQNYPNTLWCYYIGEGNQPSYFKSLGSVIAGYDCFLTQNFNVNPVLKEHVVEFPYHLQYYGCFHDLLGIDPATTNTTGISSYGNFTKEQKEILSSLMPFNTYEGRISVKTLLGNLINTKYYLFFTNMDQRGHFRGNALPEAVATGNLLLGDPKKFTNTSLFTARTSVSSFAQALERIIYFENNPELFTQELAEQRRRLDYYCFVRPMTDLFGKLQAKRKRLGSTGGL